MWKKSDMDALILKTEGEEEGNKTLRSATQMISFYIRKGLIISMKVNKSNKLTFYTSRRTWIENDLTDGGNHKIREGHEPNPELYNKIFKEKHEIIWNGM
jgi:hypothetical protein